MGFQDIKAIADIGVVGVLVFVIYIAWDIAKRFERTINNHMDHDRSSRDELTKAITELSIIIKTK